MKIKKCARCKESKSLDNFYKGRKYYNSYCKKCWYFYTKEYEDTHPKYKIKHQEVDRLYQARKRNFGLVDKTKENEKWREKHPKGSSAHGIVNYYIKIGKIKRKKCKICKEFPTYAHHEDYDKPFEIIWLCPSCHKKYHLKLVDIS